MGFDRRAALVAVACAGIAFAAWQPFGGEADGVSSTAPVRSQAAKSPASAAPRAQSAAPSGGTPFYTTDPYVERFNAPTTGAWDSILVGDVTGDGRDDVVGLGGGTNIRVAVQKSDGTFNDPLLFTTSGSPVYSQIGTIMLGDMNEDGVLDIVANRIVYDDGSAWSRGAVIIGIDQAGKLVAHTTELPSIRWDTGVVVDVDLDGHLDVVGRASDNTCGCQVRLVAYGDGTGGISREAKIPLANPISPADTTLDLNGDGVEDLPDYKFSDVAGGPLVLQFNYNDRNGGYSTKDLVPNPVPCAYGDFNRDGLNDLFTTPSAADWLYVVAQVSPGVLGQRSAPIWWMYGAAVPCFAADLDRDGAMDVLMGQGDRQIGPETMWIQFYMQRDGVMQPRLQDDGTPYFDVYPPFNVSAMERPVAAGDVNGDACTDVLIAAATMVATYHGKNCHAPDMARSDFDGDHFADVVWQDSVAGTVDLWRGARIDKRLAVKAPNSTTWAYGATGDFDGDGKSDLLWRNRTTGANVVWRSANPRLPRTLRTLADVAWSLAGTGDLDGDHKADLLWRNMSTGQNVAWRSGDANTPLALRAVPDQNWRVAAIADFDGDGRDDLFWRHGLTGANVVWRSGNANTPVATRAVAVAWQAQGAGDFDGDGKADVLWRHASLGANVVWKSADAATPMAVTALPDLAWKVAGIGDYDNDRRADILWRHAGTGTNVVWRRGNGGMQRWVKPLAINWVAR